MKGEKGKKGSGDDNRNNNSVAPTLCHGKEDEATKFCTTKIVVYYRKLTKIIYLERRLFLRQLMSIELSIVVNSGVFFDLGWKNARAHWQPKTKIEKG